MSSEWRHIRNMGTRKRGGSVAAAVFKLYYFGFEKIRRALYFYFFCYPNLDSSMADATPKTVVAFVARRVSWAVGATLAT